MGTRHDQPLQRAGKRLGRSGRASQWLLALAIAGAALAVGTVHTATLLIVTLVLGAAAALGWWDADPMRPRPAATLILVTALGLTAYTALQCVPLPASLLMALAPHNADVWSRALSPLRLVGPSFAPLTLDPCATRVEVVKGIAYALAFVGALRIARQREGARFLSATIVVTACILAVAALLHPAFGAHKLFGIYEPTAQLNERHVAPLMNPNNLAGYINVGLCLCLAMMLANDPVVPRPISGTVALLLAATQIWIASRGGVITMFLGAFLVYATGRIGRSQEAATMRVATLTILTGVCASAGTALLAIGASEDASHELLATDISKLTLFLHVMRMLPAVALFGCGRGAFESAFPLYRIDVGYVTYAYPENVIAQWVLEWGLPVAAVGFLALAIALRPSAVLARSTTASGAWAAIVALAVQNLADLGSEIPGLMLAGVTCVAIVVAGTPGHRSRMWLQRWALAPRAVAMAALAATGLGVGVGAMSLGHELHDDERALYDVAHAHGPAEKMHAMERSAMLRHPAEPYLPFVGAFWASAAHTESPLPWLGATFERANVYGPAHLMLARTIAQRSPSQARLEYRLAMQQAPEFDVEAAHETPWLVHKYFDAMELIPSGVEGERVLEMLAEAVEDRLPSTRRRLDSEILLRAPNAPGPLKRAARDAVEDVEMGEAAPWCDGLHRPVCAKDALEKAGHVAQLLPNQCDALALRARARIAMGDTAHALDELQAAANTVPDRVACLRTVADLAQASGDAHRAEAVLDLILKAGCSDDNACARQIEWVAAKQEAKGNVNTALALYKRAHDKAPDDDTALQNVARLASEAGLHGEAADAYDGLAKRHPQEPRWAVAASEERAAAAKEALKL